MGCSIRDARTLTELPWPWLSVAQSWRAIPFQWTRWDSLVEPGSTWHDHCLFCSACICNHRDRFPHQKEEHAKRGCFRHAYYGENPDGTYTWICRSCFKRIAPAAGLTRHTTRSPR